MINSFLVGALAVVAAGAADSPNQYTATGTSAVHQAQATAKTSHDTSHVPGKAFDRYISIWLENTDYDKAAGDPNLAWLAKQGITLTNNFGVTHPSEPNYAASAGGDNLGMDNDDFNQIAGNVSSIVDLLEDKGISWGSYQEDMPYSGFEGFAYKNQLTQANDYVRKHNPPVLYNSNTQSSRLPKQKNLTMFYEDLKCETLPQWMFITPNMTSDGHDTSVTVAGLWTRNFLEPLLKNEYFMKNTLILVTFDENHTYSIANRVLGILLGGAVPQSSHGSKDTRFYNHYSELSTVEANWGLHTLGKWDVGANVFDLVAKKTGDIYRPYDAVTGSSPSVYLNSSFAGPFNTDFQSGPYPAPNVDIVSPKTGRTVLPAIIKTWGKQKTYYTDSVEIPDGQHPPPGYKVNDVDN